MYIPYLLPAPDHEDYKVTSYSQYLSSLLIRYFEQTKILLIHEDQVWQPVATKSKGSFPTKADWSLRGMIHMVNNKMLVGSGHAYAA